MNQLNLKDSTIYPRGKNLLVRVIDQEKSLSKIIQMPKQELGYPQFGEIIRVGPMVQDSGNTPEIALLKPGKIVTFNRVMATSTIKIDDDNILIVLSQDEIHSVIAPNLPLVAANDSNEEAPTQAE